MEKSLEGSGKVPRIVQVMYFKGMPRQMNQQPEVGLPQQWEAQWQEFLNTLQPPAHAGWGNLQLTDTVPWDDTWAFLAAFEQVAEACQWPREEWVRQLLPALRGGMEQSFCRLDARDRGDYMKVKAAILRADALRMEMKRQHFRQCCYQELEGPRRVYSQLQDLCRQWLKPEKHTKEQILEMIIQEQLLGMLPAEVQNWVRECGPKDCIEMVALAEDFLTGHRPPPRSCDWQVPLPEVPASSSESEGRQRQPHPGASEATSTRNSVLAHSSAGLEMTGTGTTEQPVRVKEELGLDQKPIHWEVMQERSSSSSALEGLLVPTPELNSQADEPQATFQERPEHRDPIPDTLFGGRIIGEIRIETFQQAISEAEDDFGTLRGEESSGTVPLNPESFPLDPEKQLGARQPEEVQKRKCPRRRRRACKKKGKRSPLEKKYTCLECGYKAYYYSKLVRHMKSHAAKELHECLECGKIYRDRPCFENHVRSHLPLDDPSRRVERARTRNSSCQRKEECTCFKCGVVKSSPSGLAEHMKVHTDERPYECPECGKLFKWRSNLSRHRGLHTSRRFSSRQLMRRGTNESNKGHSNSKKELLGEPSTVLLSAVSDSDPVSRPHPKGLKTLKVMLKKLPRPQKGEYKGPVGDRRVPELSKTIKDRRPHPGERSYDCSDCGKAFRKPYHLYRHQSGIACRKPRPIICDAVFAEEKIACRGGRIIGEIRIETFQQAISEAEDDFGTLRGEESSGTVPLNPESFPLDLEEQLGARQPEEVRKRKCPRRRRRACKKKGKHSPLEKKYTCLECGHKAYYYSNLLRHMKSHAAKELHECLECGKIYRDRPCFENHVRSHLPLDDPNRRVERARTRNSSCQRKEECTCFKCGVVKSSPSGLAEHMKVHTDERPYECPECGKLFKWRSNLSRHRGLHTSRRFSSRQLMRRGTNESNKGHSNSTQELLGEPSTVLLSAVSDSDPVSRPHPNGLKTLKVMLKKLPSAQKGEYKGPDGDRRVPELSKTIKDRRAHPGERSYDCSDCGKAFRKPYHLYRHQSGIACRKPRPIICDAVFAEEKIAYRGTNESNKGHSNSTQELLGEPSTVLLSAVSDSDPVSRPHPNGLKTLKVMLKKLPSAQKGEYKGPVGDRRVPELSKTIKDRRAHPGERSYDCSDCGKSFRKPYHLYRHQTGIACRKPRPIICDAVFVEEKIACRGEEESRSATLLQENIKLEDEDGAYPACNDQPSLRSSLKTEQREGSAAGNEASEHPNTKMHSCTKCGYQTEKLSDILKHFRNHKEKPYKCLDCGKCFRWFSTLIKHQQTHVASPQPPVIAECDVTLSDDEELINILAKKPPRQEAGVRNFLERPSKRSPAAVCPVSKSSRVEASPAIRSREQNGKGKAARHRKKSKKARYEGLEKKHECLDCGHRTYFLSDLVRHKRAHPNDTPYRCPECQKLFVQPSFLKLHLKTHKTERKSVNTKKAPQGERKYTCSKCGHKTYKLSTHLLHMRTHMSEKERAYICDECGKAFKWSSNLSRHKRIHALNEGFKIRRPTFSGCYEINRDDETPKKTRRVRLKKRSRFQASTASEMEALREHWRNYKRQQRKKATEKPQKTEEKEEKERKEEKENVAEKEVKEEEESRNEEKENVAEKEVKEKNVVPELSLRARLEKFAYSKSRGKEPSQEVAASEPKVSAEELLHHECTVCGKNFTYDGQLADHQNLHTEAKPHRCQECQK